VERSGEGDEEANWRRFKECGVNIVDAMIT
jgi:hypothetical protein